jgi:1,4-dihydroxy-2-naphthoate polyprenyltransferase
MSREVKLSSWILAARPKTLTAALVPILAACALAIDQQIEIHWWIPLCALISSLLIQIATNLVNDFSDFEKGADNETRLGPTRATAAGLLSLEQVKRGAFVSFCLAAVFGLPLIFAGGWPILLIGCLSVLAGYAYTSGPYPLAYHGLGDVFVIFFFGIIAVAGTFYLLSGQWTLSAAVLGLQVGLHAAVLIAINNLRDIFGDAKVGKRTLSVRFGVHGSRLMIAAFCFLPFVLSLFWVMQNNALVFFMGLLPFPFALFLTRKVFLTEPSIQYNSFLAEAARLHLLFAAFTSVGFIL